MDVENFLHAKKVSKLGAGKNYLFSFN